MKKIVNILFVLMLTLVVGCSSSNNESEEANTSESSGTYPIVIEHAFGETTIEEEPERIATLFWGNNDVPLALDIAPVGVSMANYGNVGEDGLLPWTSAKFEELGVEPNVFNDLQGIDFEAVASCEPDVILAAYSGMTEEEYELLSEIAPVLPHKDEPWQANWKDTIIQNSEAMGKLDEGQKLVADLEKLIEDKMSEYPELIGKKIAYTSFDASDLSSFWVYLPNDPRVNYLNDMGLENIKEIEELESEDSSFAVSLSSENVDILNSADIVITYGDDQTLQLMQDDPIIGKVPAIENGNVLVIDHTSDLAAASTPSALSIPATIDEMIEALNQAASN